MSFVSELEPRSIWSHFDEILKIPRASKNEERMREYVLAVAKKKGLEHQKDGAGNVVVIKPGTKGLEKTPVTILQSHLDMVQEKDSSISFNFDRDAIRPVRLDPSGHRNQKGIYLGADGTTLGSDNGIGVASMLTVMEASDLTHGPLEFLYTVDEESGLTGAAGLADGLLKGRRLINVDSEEEGVLTIGCAGGADSELFVPLSKETAPKGSRGLELEVTGLKGGHSGIDIHLQRGNAIRILSRVLDAARVEAGPFRFVSFQGGSAHNAIPREAKATVAVQDPSAAEALRKALTLEFERIREELRSVDPGVELKIRERDPAGPCWDERSTGTVLSLVNALPHGVLAMSLDIPGLVETSTNLAVVGEKEGRFSVLMSSRSSVASALADSRRRIRATAMLAGAEVEEEKGYPGWKPDVNSKLLQVVKSVHQEVTGHEPKVGAIHAGLECGIIGEKYPGMDMISFGPQIEFPHSPHERVKIPSVGTFYELLRKTLERLAA